MSSRSGVRRGAGKMGYSLSLRTSGHSRGRTRGNGSSLPNGRDSRQRQSIMTHYEFLRVSIVTTSPAFVDGGGL